MQLVECELARKHAQCWSLPHARKMTCSSSAHSNTTSKAGTAAAPSAAAGQMMTSHHLHCGWSVCTQPPAASAPRPTTVHAASALPLGRRRSGNHASEHVASASPRAACQGRCMHHNAPSGVHWAAVAAIARGPPTAGPLPVPVQRPTLATRPDAAVTTSWKRDASDWAGQRPAPGCEPRRSGIRSPLRGGTTDTCRRARRHVQPAAEAKTARHHASNSPPHRFIRRSRSVIA